MMFIVSNDSPTLESMGETNDTDYSDFSQDFRHVSFLLE